MRIGYARASTVRQSLDTQADSLRAAGVTRIFAEKISTRAITRPELDKAVALASEMRASGVAVTIVVHEHKRLGRGIELGEDLAARQRAIMLICFLYDNPGFQVLPSRHHTAVKAQVSAAIRQGVEIWQVNFGLDDTGVRVLSYHELTRQLSA